jgi:RNA polymerase sigma-70 factor, ECF subfamily
MDVASATGSDPVLDMSASPVYEVFFRREFPAIRAVVWALVGNVWVAEELAQEAFARAHRSWARINTYDEPGAWVRRVAINLACSSLRRRAREVAALAKLGGRRQDDWEIPETSREFWGAVRALPHRQAAVLALHYYEDLSVADIAAVLGIAEGTVKVHLHRGRDALRERLQDGKGGGS